jgi:hypothetical protein
MFVRGRCVLMSLLAMFVGRVGVILRLFVLAKIMMMGGLMMMMGCGVMMSGGLMMMLTSRMLGLCHGAIPPNRSWKTMCRLQLRYGAASLLGNRAPGGGQAGTSQICDLAKGLTRVSRHMKQSL